MDTKLSNKEHFLYHFKEMSKSFFLFLEENNYDSSFLVLSISLQVLTEEISKSLNIPYPTLLKFIHLGEKIDGKI